MIRQRFSDFIESLQEPRRKYRAVCFLLIFLCIDFLLGGIYFLWGFFSLKSIGPAAEMAAEISELYQISVYVDTSEYLWWSLPFFALAAATAALTARYIIRQQRIFARAKAPARVKERINARENAVVAVRVHAVDPTQAKKDDLRNAPPAWLLDPLAVVSHDETTARPAAEAPKQPQTEQTTYNQPPFAYTDFVRPHTVSAPHNRVRMQDKKQKDIPYAGSLQYVERKDKKKERSPYANY